MILLLKRSHLVPVSTEVVNLSDLSCDQFNCIVSHVLSIYKVFTILYIYDCVCVNICIFLVYS